MKKSKRPLQAVALAAVGLLTLWQGMALAGEAPAPPEVPSAEAPSAPSASEPSAPAEAPSSSSSAPAAPQTATLQEDSTGHTTPVPEGDSHASAGVADVHLAGEELVSVNQTNAAVDDDDDTPSGDVTVLALGGSEIIGAHSSGNGSDSNGLAIACEESGGQLCIGLLYASTETSQSAGSSSSNADASLVFLCLGGTTTAPGPVCDGPVGAEVGGSHSSIEETRSGGIASQSAHAETELADVCLGGEDASGVCSGLGVSAVGAHSDSSATDPDAPGTTDSDSWLLAIEAQGSRTQILGDSQELLSIPPGCPEDGSLICIFLNQGAEVVGNGIAGNRVETVHLDVLKAVGQVPGDSLILAHLGTAETLVKAEFIEVEECPPGTVGTPPDCVEANGGPPDGDDEDGVLPRGGPPTLAITGLGALPLLALSLILGTAGGSVLAWDRRRTDKR
ncbi:MAG: hypothetical protein ACRDI0_00840 [Actinomycetota bacterium]